MDGPVHDTFKCDPGIATAWALTGAAGGGLVILVSSSTSRRPPVAVMPASDAVGLVVENSAFLICGADAPGWVEA